jgi:hypothetical protein
MATLRHPALTASLFTPIHTLRTRHSHPIHTRITPPQVVATALHASNGGRLPRVSVAWASDDVPDLDNTLNMLSALSLPLSRSFNWGRTAPMLAAIAAALLPARLAQREGLATPLPLGGNSVAGVLGQVSGALELAEQIQRGTAPDPTAIYLPVGSSCTISGLVLGVALSRHLKLSAFRQSGLEIVGVPVHQLIAKAQRLTGLQAAKWAQAVPLTARHSVTAAAAALAGMGGPDLKEEAVRVLTREVGTPEHGTSPVHSRPSRPRPHAAAPPTTASPLVPLHSTT